MAPVIRKTKGEGLYRRSLYRLLAEERSRRPNMVNFDAPTRRRCTVRENRTNTPLQALNLMNDVVYLEASRKLAELHDSTPGSAPDQRIRRGYELVLARCPCLERRRGRFCRALDRFKGFYNANK